MKAHSFSKSAGCHFGFYKVSSRAFAFNRSIILTFAPEMNIWRSIFTGRCPRCGVGKVFESRNPYNLSKMLNTRKECPNCHLDFIPEIGFYWGATYVAYGITVAFSGFTFLISTLLFGFMSTLNMKYVTINGILLVLLCPIFFRFSRMLWLSLAHD